MASKRDMEPPEVVPNQTLCDFTNNMAMSMTKRTNAQSFPAVIIIIAPESCFKSLNLRPRASGSPGQSVRVNDRGASVGASQVHLPYKEGAPTSVKCGGPTVSSVGRA